MVEINRTRFLEHVQEDAFSTARRLQLARFRFADFVKLMRAILLHNDIAATGINECAIGGGQVETYLVNLTMNIEAMSDALKM